MSVYRNLIVKISDSVLFCRFGNLPERTMDEKLYAEEKDKRKCENDCCGDVYLSHDRSASLFDGRDGTVDQKVSLCRKTLCHRRHNGDHIFVKISVICTCNIAVSADFGRVEVFDPIRTYSVF